MSEDATSQPSTETTNDNPSATEDDQAQQMLAEAATQPSTDKADTDPKPAPVEPDKGEDDNDKLGDSGKRALARERQDRRAAEKELKELRARVQEIEDAEKTELQKAQEAAQRYETELNASRVANARLMAAAAHNLPPDLIDILGDGTEEEIDARAKLLADKLAAVPPPPAKEADERPSPATSRPVESLTPGAAPASAQPEDPNAWLRRMAGRAP